MFADKDNRGRKGCIEPGLTERGGEEVYSDEMSSNERWK